MAERSDRPPESLVERLERQHRDERISPMVRPSEQKGPGGAWDDDLRAAWSVVEEAAEGSPLYNGIVHSALRDLRARLDAADPLRAILPEVVEALENAAEFISFGVSFGFITKPRDGTPESNTLPAIEELLSKLRALTATEGGTDDEGE